MLVVRGKKLAAAGFALLGACADEPSERGEPTAVVSTHPDTAKSATKVPNAESAAAPPPGKPSDGSPHGTAGVVVEPDPWVRGTVEPGDSLGEILQGIGLSAAAIHAVATAMTPRMDPSTIRAGQTWAAHLDIDGSLLELRYARSKTETLVVRPDAKGGFSIEAEQAETEASVVEVSGTIESSLWNAVTDAGEHGALVPLLVDVFASNVDFYTDPRRGDAFRVIVEKELLDGEHLRYGRVLAAEYRGEVGTFVGAWWTPPGGRSGGYFDEDGNSLDRTLLKSPLKFARISSKFNPRRMHPVLHRVKGHFGTDYAAPEGTPIWAAADGKIVFRGRKGGAGNMVIVAHDSGLRTLYMHMSRFTDGQEVGTRIRQKTVIGYVGQTGLATGPHLHFAVRRNGRYVDPEEVKSVPRPGVPRKHRARFRRATRALFERLRKARQPDAVTASATARPEETTSG